jgi:hypothetical protein
MYIRWKEKPRKPQWGYDQNHHWRSGGGGSTSTLLIAYLAESKRIDGKPRQHAHYLASIQTDQLDAPHHRLRFWQAAQKKLQPLNLSPEQQQAMKTALLKKVPDVTREQREVANKEMNEAMARLQSL